MHFENVGLPNRITKGSSADMKMYPAFAERSVW